MTDCVMGEQKLLSELRVTELKQELEKRNLDKNGIKIILTDRLEKALIADGHDPATYLFRVNETVASPGSVKPTSPTISPAASMENLADGNEEKKEEHTSENGNGTGTAAGEAHDEPMESESATPAKDGGAENADNLDTSKELVIVDEPAADAAAPAADEEMLEDPLIDVPTETSAPAAAAAAKPAVTVTTSSAVKTPVQAPANDDKEKDTASRSIWVRGLTSATKAADLKVLCTQFGKVVRAKIYTSKKQTTSACYGYVTMADTAAAEKAATALHKTQYKGRTISVEKADRSKVPAVKSASAAAAPTKKDAAGDSTASAKRGESEKKTSDETSKSAKSASMAGEKSQSESKGGKRAGSTTSTTQSKRDDSRSDRKRDDKDARRSSNSERRDSGTRRVFAYTLQAGKRPLKSSDSKREPFRRAPARDPRRDSQRTITAARRFPATSTRGLPSRSLRGRITRPGDRTSSYLSMRRPEAMTQRDLLSLMRRKEEEHRRREAEIEKERALERERERIRFEREQLEKERLQLQLQAALQQQKLAAMSSSRTKDTYLPSSVRGSSRGRHSDYRDSRDSRGDKLSSSVHRRSAGDSRRPAADDRSRSRHVGGGDRSGASRIDRDRSEHKPSAASSRDRSRHESYGSSRGHSSSQPAAYSRKDYDRGYTSSRDTTSYGGRGGSSYYGNSRDAYSSSATSRIGGSSGGWGSSSGAGYGSSAWEGGSGSAVGHSSSGSAWGGRGAAGSNGWSTFGSGGGTSSSSSMRYDYDKYQQRF